VYYCWPGDPAHDMVPKYSSAIEGVNALLLSPDEEEVLLVFERGAWTCPGGAVDEGECSLEAVAREVHEEVGVQVDWRSESVVRDARYLGGYQESRARDNLVNDCFSAYSVRTERREIQVDNVEISKAKWFRRQVLLDAWEAPWTSRPSTRRRGMSLGGRSTPSR